MHTLTPLALGLVLVVSIGQAAELITGNTLAVHCPAVLDRLDGKPLSPDAAQVASFCLGFLSGADYLHEALTAAGSTPAYCLPREATVSHIIRVLVSYLREHPDQAHTDGGTVALAALRDAYPCPKSR